MKTYLMYDNRAENYYIKRYQEGELKEEKVGWLSVGESIQVTDDIGIVRES